MHFNVTKHPTVEWTLQQLWEALPGDKDYKFVLHDRDKSFSPGLDEEVASWGIRVLPTPVRMPTSNAHCERVIGSIRRECLDCVIPLNASHLRRTLREWMCHYNIGRPHQSLGPGIPDRVRQTPTTSKLAAQLFPFLRAAAKPILGGLHHEYRWKTRLELSDRFIAEQG